jgi:glutamate-1-semialdehyde aminotransferase
MANGFPLAAIVGKKDIINEVKDQIFVSSTYGGECVSLAAFIANVKFIRENNVYAHINKIGTQIKDGLNTISKKYGSNIRCIGLPPRLNFAFENLNGEFCIKIKTLFLQELIKCGVYYIWTILPNYAMNDHDVKFLLDVFDDCVRICSMAEKNNNFDDVIEGEYPRLPL